MYSKKNLVFYFLLLLPVLSRGRQNSFLLVQASWYEALPPEPGLSAWGRAQRPGYSPTNSQRYVP